jgi:DNA gyrase subunit A
MLITQKGIVVRIAIKSITTIGRATQGVKLINLDRGDKLVDVARVIPEEKVEELE